MKTSHGFVPFLVGALVACGGSSSNNGGGTTGSVTGTAAGVTLNVASTLATPTWSSSTVGGCAADSGTCAGTVTNVTHGIGVLFTNRADFTCSAVQGIAASGQETVFANIQELGLEVNVLNGDVATGTYDIVSPETNVTGAVAFLTTTTASCAQATEAAATAGTVTISQVDGSRVAGTYSVTFGTQGSLSGAFDAAICGIDAGSTSGGLHAVCKP